MKKAEIHQLQSRNPQETKKLARRIVGAMEKKGIIYLYGGLGAGKTIFAKGCGAAFGIDERSIKSPSFTYVREYTVGEKKIYHCDFYRLADNTNFGIEMIRNIQENSDPQRTLIIVEWADRVEISEKNAKALPLEFVKSHVPKKVEVFITVTDEQNRMIIWKTKL